MTAKEQFDACMKIAVFGAGRWDERRQYDWRLTFAIWALIVAGISFVSAQELSVFAGIILVTLYLWWMRGVWLRNCSDRRIVWNAVNTAQSILLNFNDSIVVPSLDPRLKPVIKNPIYRDHFGFLSDWADSFRILVTVVLISFFYATKVQSITLWSIANITISR